MKKAWVLMVIVCFLSGCAKENQELQRGMMLRSQILQSNGCSFDCKITADYGDMVYQFMVACQADDQGNLSFAVQEPDSIRGITGKIGQSGGLLTFDDQALHVGLLTDDQINPISAPWVFFRALRSGCITSAGPEGDKLRLSIDDSYEEDALHLDVWTDDQNIPLKSEILFDGKKILSLDVINFRIL